MSKKGWHLIDNKGFFYYFEKGIPIEKEYFVYSPSCIGEGKYSIALQYPHLIKTYGVGKKKSKLNKNSIIKCNTIFEVDTERIDIKNDIYYNELKHDRNRLYLLMTIRNIVLFLTFVLIGAIVCFSKR